MSSETDGKSGATDSATGAGRPGRVGAAALICGLQGVVVAGLGIFMLLLLAFGDPDDPTQAATGGVTVLVLAALPLAAGHGLWRLRRWSRGPAVAVQLLALPTAFTMLGAGGLWPVAAIGLAATSLAVLVCLVNPAAMEALGIGTHNA
ncbi:hypothetical protein [Streptomyces sp. 6N223]|uniref:hypothetical protein n=1 Tax=Streptomyces sp. 6N223 TaxID=3457412 RepID=UPI003FD3883B